MNKRNELKQAIQARLNDTFAGSVKVYLTRFLDIAPEECPLVSIYTLEESSEPDAARVAQIFRPNVAVVVYAAGETVDVDLDSLCGQIESALVEEHSTLMHDGAAVVRELLLRNTKITMHDKSEEKVLTATMTFQGVYLESIGDEDQGI